MYKKPSESLVKAIKGDRCQLEEVLLPEYQRTAIDTDRLNANTEGQVHMAETVWDV